MGAEELRQGIVRVYYGSVDCSSSSYATLSLSPTLFPVYGHDIFHDHVDARAQRISLPERGDVHRP